MVIRQSGCASEILTLECQAKMEFDGYINFSLRLSAQQAAQVKDIRLEIPFRKDVAAYMMGLGRKGGYRPHEWKWTWDVNRAINNVWIGDYNAGLQLKLKGPEDTWDIYNLKAAGIPTLGKWRPGRVHGHRRRMTGWWCGLTVVNAVSRRARSCSFVSDCW